MLANVIDDRQCSSIFSVVPQFSIMPLTEITYLKKPTLLTLLHTSLNIQNRTS